LKPTSVASALPAAAFGLLVATLAWRSLPWPLVHDAPIMHYVAWRIAHGAVPYRDLFDMNQPGVYLLHLLVLQTLGAGDFAWRLFDLAWLAATAAAIAAFAAPWGAAAAAGGALVFAAYHLSGGAWQAGQRDFLLCLFLVLGALGVTRWLERRRLASLLWSGAVLGAGVTVKPHAALLAGALAALVVVAAARATGLPGAVLPALAFVAAVAAVPVATLAWLAAIGALGPWRDIVVDYLVPLYSRLGRASSWTVYRWHVWIPLSVGVAVSLASAAQRRAAGWRHAVATLGVGYGLAHYLAQGKGWEYHLYPLAAFVALLLCSELGAALAARRAGVGAVLAASLAAVLVLLGAKGLEAAPAEWWWNRERVVRAVVADVGPLLRPGDTVQVLDTAEGGVHALLRLGVREPTRFLYDFHFFHDVDTPVVRALRAELARDLAARPPRAIVLFERAWPAGGYERVATFPALAERLAHDYTLARERPGFRVYAKRHDS
jgi:hypothetical protein